QVDSFAGTHLVVDDSAEVPPKAVEAGVHATVVGIVLGLWLPDKDIVASE
ncbi:hypothetical protein A2U01_0109290, partial [Trifolium medium]|nr:hypothetical protein [Trifolium medium]